jgi:putative PLP-dependent aminotransferase (TIGR04422 family)
LKNKYFLWPEGRLVNAFNSFWNLVTTEQVENKLYEIFPTGHPVLCSSGRSALYLALLASGTSRKKFVGVFPNASHCVLESISRIATPSTGKLSYSAALRLIYHQWGYVQEYSLASNTIEDCVDTLCIPGTELFPSGGKFEIWSIPKILGTTSGGILWCKNKEEALQIKNLRNNHGSSLFQWILRLLSKKYRFLYNYWQGGECVTGRPSIFQTNEIMSAIYNWDNIVIDRKKKLDLAWPLALKGLQKPNQRLPTVVPVECEMEETQLNHLGVTSGYRIFEFIKEDGTHKMIKVLPLPVHQEVDANWLMDMCNIISKSNNLNA